MSVERTISAKRPHLYIVPRSIEDVLLSNIDEAGLSDKTFNVLSPNLADNVYDYEKPLGKFRPAATQTLRLRYSNLRLVTLERTSRLLTRWGSANNQPTPRLVGHKDPVLYDIVLYE